MGKGALMVHARYTNGTLVTRSVKFQSGLMVHSRYANCGKGIVFSGKGALKHKMGTLKVHCHDQPGPHDKSDTGSNAVNVDAIVRQAILDVCKELAQPSRSATRVA